MQLSTAQILDVLRKYNIQPLDDDFADTDLPGIGEIGKNEGVYSTSLKAVFGEDDDDNGLSLELSTIDKPRTWEWQEELGLLIGDNGQQLRAARRRRAPEAPEPHCAWYCPIHFFGHGWGIFIRESCILSHALDIAAFVDWSAVKLPRWEIQRHLLRSAFYVFYLHEQFHHKVESLGFRLLVSTGADRYRPYKANVYRPRFNTSDCIEETLANAESYRRLGEPRYIQRVHVEIRKGLRTYMRWAIPKQPPGYREGVKYISEIAYRKGLFNLQSQMVDGLFPPTTPPEHWSIAPNLITSLCDISEDIYLVLPRGGRPIFRTTHVDPGATASTRDLESALTRHYGYQRVPGGKGSHLKLAKPGSPTLVLPGNRSTVSPGVVKQVLDAIGGHPISRLPDLLDGRLETHA